MTEPTYSDPNLTPENRTISSNRLPRRSLTLGLGFLGAIGAIANSAIAYEEFSIPLDTGAPESATTYTPEPEPAKTWEPAPQDSYAEPEPYYEPPVQESY
ncbi:MAG: M23 family metallopeptidase, partial [Limnospira sp.]